MSFEHRDAALIVGLALLAALAVLTVVWRLVRKRLRTGRLSALKVIILGGCLLFLLCGLFPPWLYTRSGHTESSAGYYFLLTTPQPKSYSNSGISLDAQRLAIEWLCILLGSGMALILVAKSGGGHGKAPEAAGSDKHVATTPPPETGPIEAAASQTTAKTESPSPRAGKRRRIRWMTLTSVASLAIIVISLVVWAVHKPKADVEEFTLDDFKPKPKAEEFTEADFQEEGQAKKPKSYTFEELQALETRPVPGKKPNQSRSSPERPPWEYFIPDNKAKPQSAPDKKDIFDQLAPDKPDIFDEIAGEVAPVQPPATEKGPWNDFSAGTTAASMKVIEIKGVGLIYFPGAMSAKQIRDVLRRRIGSVRHDEIKAKLDVEFTPLKTAPGQWRYFPTSRGP